MKCRKSLLMTCFALTAIFFTTCTPTPFAPSPTQAPTDLPTADPSPALIPPTPTLVPLTVTDRERLFDQVWTLVRDKYVYSDYRGVNWQGVRADYAQRISSTDTPEAFHALMKEMIDELGDKSSLFLSPTIVARRKAANANTEKYYGIGMAFISVPEGQLVTGLVRAGPAEAAGLVQGEIITAVDGIPALDTQAFGPDGLIGAVRGPAGTVVRLTVQSLDKNIRMVQVSRQPITDTGDVFAPQAQRLPGTKIGLLSIRSFMTNDMGAQVKAQLEKLLQTGPLDGLIIDIRPNNGGNINPLCKTLELFLNVDIIGKEVGREKSQDIRLQSKTTPFQGMPIAVLTSPQTVGAGVMFAGIMQYFKRSRVVGMPTADLPPISNLHDLMDGSQLMLAEQFFVFPDGNQLLAVKPDRIVDVKWYIFTPTDDPQIKAALEELTKE